MAFAKQSQNCCQSVSGIRSDLPRGAKALPKFSKCWEFSCDKIDRKTIVNQSQKVVVFANHSPNICKNLSLKLFANLSWCIHVTFARSSWDSLAKLRHFVVIVQASHECRGSFGQKSWHFFDDIVMSMWDTHSTCQHNSWLCFQWEYKGELSQNCLKFANLESKK